MTLKTVMIVAALIAGGTSLALAQAQGSSGPDGQLTTAAGAADNPPAPGTRTARHHRTHHRMYMSTRGKKDSLNTGTNGGY
jgi:hypothetical protein